MTRPLFASCLAATFVMGSCAVPSNLQIPLTRGDALGYGVELSPVPTDRDHVRFAVIGDAGNANHVQGTIAQGVHKACRGACDFTVLLGDNVYEAGLEGRADENRLACIVDRYPTKHVYAVLGNHDYTIIGPDPERAKAQLGWFGRDTAIDGGAEGHGSHHFYRFSAGPVDVVGIDTNYLVRSKLRLHYEDLVGWLGRLQRRDGRWTIVMGHHPYLSNGTHGNAGSFRDGGLKIWPGRFFQHFMRKHVLGRAHLYLAGHDHNLQFFADMAGSGTAQVLSGAGAKCKHRGDAENDAEMERYGYGFAIVDASTDTLTVSYFDFRGREFYKTSRTSARPQWSVQAGAATSRDATYRCELEFAEMSPATSTPCPQLVE